MTKKTLLLFSLVALLAVGSASPAFARRGSDDNQMKVSRYDEDESENESENEQEVETESEDVSDDSKVRTREQLNLRIVEKRTELERKFEARKEKRKEKLEGKRFELCEKREDRINRLLQSSAENVQKKLVVFQRIEQGVKTFYENKNLSAVGYDSAVNMVDEAEAAAIAAIDAMSNVSFECDDADGSNPGVIISTAARARHDALKEYKTAVRELIVVVKQALQASNASEDATKEDSSSLDQGN